MSRLATKFSRNSHSLRADQPLTDDQIRRVAPSIFAEVPHARCSARYSQIPTSLLLARLRREGFEPFMVCQSRTRDPGRRDFTKHMLRLRHASTIRDREAYEVVMVNSHDTGSSFQLIGGVLNFVCQNGLICGNDITDVRVEHKGDIAERVIEGAYAVLNDAPMVTEEVEAMKAITLTPDEEQVLARTAIELRFGVEEGRPLPVTERQVLQVHRAEERAPTLWNRFNVIQEALVGGGLRGRTPNGRKQTTRAVEGIDSNTKLNRALWALAARMKKLKA